MRSRDINSARRWPAALLAAATASLLGAQDPAAAKLSSPMLFLEKAYFSPFSPTGKRLMFEGRPTVHYFIYNGLNDGVWQQLGGWRFAVPVSGLFIVRMVDSTSQPVLTPSYRIRPFYLQAIHLRRKDPARKKFQMIGLALGATHYSNGQQGCTYRGFTRASPTSDCVVSNAAIAAQRTPNTLDGDFSTTYFSLTGHLRNGLLKSPFAPLASQWTVGGELQIHPLEVPPGGMNGEQARQYGQHQWSMDADWERRRFATRFPGVFRVAGEYEERFGGGVAKRLRRGSLEVSYVLDRVEHMGVFARQHLGYDYYNINYKHTKPFFTFGLMWDMGRLDLFESETAQ
jgi:hypothetical protein